MLTCLFLTSGLFLGWLLGAQGASNIFDRAIKTRMVKFKTAAVIGALFVVLGGILQGHNTTGTLNELVPLETVGGAFTIALCAALVVITTTAIYRFPASTSQAIVGAIIGWSFYTSAGLKSEILFKIIASWLLAPILSAACSFVLYFLVRKSIRSSRMHVLKKESILRFFLILAGALAAYSLGANNIANVTGVFKNSFSTSLLLGGLHIPSAQLLSFIASLAIALGFFTYNKKTKHAIGNGILSMTSETIIVIVMAQALVMFVFSGKFLSGIFSNMGFTALAATPVSSSQILVGALVGVGLIKGILDLEIKKALGKAALSAITTPLLSLIITFISLFFMNNVFGIQVANRTTLPETLLPNEAASATRTYQIASDTSQQILIGTLVLLVLAFSIYMLIRNRRSYTKGKSEGYRQAKEYQLFDYKNALGAIEETTVQLENVSLATQLEKKKQQLITYSLNIGEQRRYLEHIAKSIKQAINSDNIEVKDKLLKEQLMEIEQRMSFTGEVDEIYRQAEQVHMTFIEKINESYPNLTNKERKILVLLRIGLSSKEMSPLLNISTKSVEIARYRLRNKMGLDRNKNLTEFIQSI